MSSKKEAVVSDTEVKPIRTLKPEVQALADKIVAGLTINKADGVVTETTTNYVNNLPENITPEIDTAVTQYRQQFVAGSALAVGQLAADALAGNKKLDVVTAELGMSGGDVTRHSVTRSKDFPYTQDGERHVRTIVGAMRSEVDVKGGHNSGQLKIARQMVGQLVTERLEAKSKK